MRIGELAQRSDCDVETVRFYEREGLLDLPDREANGYRRYSEAHLVQIKFIRHCRSLGMGPVSYTHLDVYKRQALLQASLPSASREASLRVAAVAAEGLAWTTGEETALSLIHI